MRRFLFVSLLAVWAVMFGAHAASAQKTKIVWWDFSDPPQNAYSKDLVARFNQANPNLSAEYEVFAMTPYFKKLSVALSTKAASDMFSLISFLMPSLTSKGRLAPIRPEWLGHKSLEDMKAAYLPGALDGYIFEGKLYAVPFVSQTMSLYLNKKHFREAGLDPDKDYPRTWDDIARVGKKLVKVEGGKMVREAFDFAMHSSTWTMLQVEPLIRQFGGSVLDPAGNKCVANSEAGVKAMNVRASFALVHRISDPSVSVGTHALPAQDMAMGRMSMFITHPGSVAQFGPKLMQDFKVVPHPQVDPSKPVTPTYGFAYAVSPDIPAERQREVHRLIRHVVADVKGWLDKVGKINPVRGVLDIPGVRQSPYIDVFVRDISAGQHPTRTDKYNEVADALHRAMERVVLKREDPKKSLDQACKEIDEALAKP